MPRNDLDSLINPRGDMHSTVEQTLTSCLLARKIWRHAQREGSRGKKSNQQKIEEKDKPEKRAIAVSAFWNTKLQTEEDGKDMQQETDLAKNLRHTRCDKKKR